MGERSNPNNCASCRHKQNPDGGHCYMFRFEPAEMCVHHTSQIHALQALRMRRNQKAKTMTNPTPHGQVPEAQALSAAPATPTAEQQASPKAAPAQQAGEAAESVPAVEREQERIAFKDAHRHLELYEVPDAWGRPMFKHSHVEASWFGWIARASHEQASSQAGEYPALVCDYCGALTPDPWHSSGMLHGKMSKHIHSCDACAARGVAKAQAAKQQEQLI